MSKEHYLSHFVLVFMLRKASPVFPAKFWVMNFVAFPRRKHKISKKFTYSLSAIICEELIGVFISWLTELFQLCKDQILFIVLQRAHIKLHLSFTWAALAWRTFAHKWKEYIPCLDDELWHIEIILLWTIKCWDNVRPRIPHAGGLCSLLRT